MSIGQGDQHAAQIWLHHKEGYRVPVFARTSPLRDDCGNIIGGLETFADNSERMADLERITELERMAYLDPLTGLANRRYTETVLTARFAEQARFDQTFGLILCDIDHFKQVNDTYGHDVGDRVLKMVAQTLGHNVRTFDLVGRWGGEEFVIVVANVSVGQLQRIAEGMRILVAQSSLDLNGDKLSVTMSAGGTTALRNDSPATLLQRADALLYESKAAGRDRVSVVPIGQQHVATD